MKHYRKPYPTPESRKPILKWPREIPVAQSPRNVYDSISRAQKWLLSTEIPKLFFHATPGAIVNPNDAKWLKENLKNTQTIHLGPGGHYLQEVYPTKIGSNLAGWVKGLNK